MIVRHTATEFRAKARQNRSIASRLNRDDPAQVSWAIVAFFYAALHFVNAYSARHNTFFASHKHRNQR